jgi:hypothetical protein
MEDVVNSNREAEIQARLMVVVARAHRPLTEDELSLVRSQIERDLQQRDKMRSLPLTNGDAPGTGFNPRMTQVGGVAW